MMRNKMKSLLGRRSVKASRLKPVASLAISRIAVLKHQRQARCSQARSDVVNLLQQQGNHERALLRVEQVIKEQNMLDVYDMLEGYCNLLIERVHLIEQERECPDELREATSSLLHAATRCGDFPELHEIRSLLTCHFGKDFAARAVELRNNCGVNPAMIQKLSTRQPSLEHRMTLLKEIASANNILLQDDSLSSTQVSENKPPSLSARKNKYKDVADAAQAAFESAAYAAAAARAAVELSRSGQPTDHDDSDHVESQSQTQSHLEQLNNENTDDDDPDHVESQSQTQSHLEQLNKENTDDDDDDDDTPTHLNLEKPPISIRTTRLRGF